MTVASWPMMPILFLLKKWRNLAQSHHTAITINAISVDRENWRHSGIDYDFGERASRLADAYVKMGVKPTFTCAPSNPPFR